MAVITQAHVDQFTAANAVLFVNGVVAVDGTVFTAGGATVLKAVANSGYKMVAVSYRTGTGGTKRFTVAPDELTATGDGASFATSSNFTVNTEITAPPVPVPIFTFTQAQVDSFTTNNAKLFIADVLVTDGTGFFTGDIVTAKADDGYKLVSVSYRSGSGSVKKFTVAPNGLTATSDLSNFGSGFAVSSIVDAPVPIFEFTQAHVDAFTNANAKLFIYDVEVVAGTGFFTGDVVTAKANAGFSFTEISNGGASVSYRTGSGSTIYFTLTETATVATSDLRYFNSGFSVSTIILTPEVKGYNNVYSLTDDQLRDVTQSRFVVNNGQTTTDYGKYIIGLIDLPFAISPDLITGVSTVKMGGYNSGIDATLLKADYIRLEMGQITIPKIKNNLLDYKNTVAVLHLPYANAVNIDIDYVIGEMVTIEYLINLYDGVAVINLSSTKIDDVFLTLNIDMGITIPFANVETFPSKNDSRDISLGGANGVTVPFIELIRNNAVLENGFFTIPIIDETVLSDQNGFIKIEEIDLICKASRDEKEMILNAINQGVIIK